MCGGGGGGSSAGDRAQALEEQRQARIAQGMAALESIFGSGGGSKGVNQVAAGAAYDPNQIYYDSQGQRVRFDSPTSDNVPGNPDMNNNWGSQYFGARRDTDGGLFTGVEATSGFSPAFYDKAYQAQLDYALPQVEQQYQDAQKKLTYALARQGLAASSQGSRLMSDLQSQRALAIQGEQDKAQQVRTQQQANVEAERGELTRLLQQTGDVASTVNSAAARKSMLETAPALQEVGTLFQNATGTLADLVSSPYLRNQATDNVKYGGKSKGSGAIVT